MASLSPRQWWQRRAQERQEAQIPVLDLRNSEETAAPQWPEPEVLDAESEARYAEGVPDIAIDFQTRTINPERPRTVGAGYDANSQTLRIKFRPGASSQSPGGAVYDYFGVTRKEYEAVQRAISTGRFISNQLAAKDYARRY